MRTLILILAIATLGCCKMAALAQTVEVPSTKKWTPPKILPGNNPKSKYFIPRKPGPLLYERSMLC